PAGVAAADVALIPDVNHWTLMEEKDFSPAGSEWVRGKGGTPGGRVSADIAGGGSPDTAYALKRRGGMLRVVLISKGVNRYDANLAPLAVIARIPKDALDGAQWVDKPSGAADGDGLLIVRNADDANTASVVMMMSGKLVISHPTNYRDLRLQ